MVVRLIYNKCLPLNNYQPPKTTFQPWELRKDQFLVASLYFYVIYTTLSIFFSNLYFSL